MECLASLTLFLDNQTSTFSAKKNDWGDAKNWLVEADFKNKSIHNDSHIKTLFVT